MESKAGTNKNHDELSVTTQLKYNQNKLHMVIFYKKCKKVQWNTINKKQNGPFSQ